MEKKCNRANPFPQYVADHLKRFFSYDPETGVISRTDKKTKGGTINDKGYLIIKVKGKRIRAHILAWYLYYGDIPKKELDHINRNKTDNRISNLREVCSTENAENRRPRRRTNEDSGCIGIQVAKAGKKKYIVMYKKRRHSFYSLDEAIDFRKQNNLPI